MAGSRQASGGIQGLIAEPAPFTASVAAFISSQRAEHAVPHATACRALGVSPSWFYKWHQRPPSPRQRRRAELDEAVRRVFEASAGTYGSPRITAELKAVGWRIGENTVAASHT